MSKDRKEQQRERYRRSLRHLTSYEEEKARKAKRHTRGRWQQPSDDEDAAFEKMHRRPPGAEASSKKPRVIDHSQLGNQAELQGIVTWLGRGRARILAHDGERTAVLAPELAARQRASIAVGDEVTVHERDVGEDLVVAVQPRRSELVRSDGDHDERHVLAANIDWIVLVLTAERLRTGLIDRLLIAAESSGARLLVCVNKCDLPHDSGELAAALTAYAGRGVRVLVASAVRGDGIDDLRADLAGTTAAFVGHSGVGKSTLLNCLDPDSERATGAVRERDGRGRHTTTASSLRRLADGTQLVDTPGVRLFGLVAEANDAAIAFPEIVELSTGCRFRDCHHRHEPGCAVRAAAADGSLEAARYEAYLRLVGAEQ